jgi:transcription initiation factor TFIIH subunit 2
MEMTIPTFSRKEILLINSSISICDPGDIFKTIQKLKQKNVVCSVVSLSSELHVLSKLSKETNGSFFLAKDK